MPPFFFEPPPNIKLRGIGLEKAPVEASLEVCRHHESQAVFSMRQPSGYDGYDGYTVHPGNILNAKSLKVWFRWIFRISLG